MKYTIQMSKAASKALAEINARDRQRIYDKILTLGDNPRPPGCKSMAGSYAGNLRIKVGNFRVIYKVEDSRLLVLIVDLGDRKDIYR